MTLTLTDQEKRRGWLFLILQTYLVPWGAAMLCAALSIRSVTAVNLLGFFANSLLAAVFFRQLLLRSLEKSRRGRTLRTIAGGFFLYLILSNLVTGLIFTVKPDFFNFNDAGINAMIDESPILMSIAVVFAVPLAEECLFRGWIFTGLAQRSLPLAYLITSLGFALIHTAGYIGLYDPLTLLLFTAQYLVPGAVLCWTCRKADSLLAPLGLHMTINTIALFATR